MSKQSEKKTQQPPNQRSKKVVKNKNTAVVSDPNLRTIEKESHSEDLAEALSKRKVI